MFEGAAEGAFEAEADHLADGSDLGVAQPRRPTGRVRRHYAMPIFGELEIWLCAQLRKISGKSELAKAIRYALTRTPHLRPYLEHGCLEIDNNCSERPMKPVAPGRKSYLFVRSEGAARARRSPKP